MGIPSDREQYIHRLGRTGREGKDGECMLVLAPWEEYFLDEIKDLPIEKSSFLRLDPDIKVKVCLSYFLFEWLSILFYSCRIYTHGRIQVLFS